MNFFIKKDWARENETTLYGAYDNLTSSRLVSSFSPMS